MCLEGFTELMVKLSEASFRPLFHKVGLLHVRMANGMCPHFVSCWIGPPPPLHQETGLSHSIIWPTRECVCVCVHVNMSTALSCCSVADKLKSLFLLFAGHILKNATFVLDKNNLEVGGTAVETSCSMPGVVRCSFQECGVHTGKGYMYMGQCIQGGEAWNNGKSHLRTTENHTSEQRKITAIHCAFLVS